jgi:hypothetical protein
MTMDTVIRNAHRLPVSGEEPKPGRASTTAIALVLGALCLLAVLAVPGLVHSYLSILHFDRRVSFDADLGSLHLHLYGRSVFYMWVTVSILTVAGIAVLVSRRRELIQKWTTWAMIAPVVGIPLWIGKGTTAVLAAALAVVAVIEFARLAKLSCVDTGVLLGLAVLCPLAHGCARGCWRTRRLPCWRARCRRCSAVTSKTARAGVHSPASVRYGSAGPSPCSWCCRRMRF